VALCVSVESSQAACGFAPGPGNDQYSCTNGTGPGLTDLLGSNTLTFPALGGGTIAGNVTFGGGNDAVLMGSGGILGVLDEGAGTDRLVITGGRIDGGVQQGAGIDDFRMSGGTIQSLNQGDGLDTFTMSSGRIIDFFDDGDVATMTGGRIGRVNMKLDDNTFLMSDGIIDRNLVTGLGRDVIVISGGTIGGNISTSSGVDSVTVSGGSIGNGIKTGEGDDRFNWSGGIIYNTIQLEGGNDTASLSNLTRGNNGGMTQLSGGSGADSLTLSNVFADGMPRFDSWESIAATNGTQLMFGGNLTLGDADTGTGTLSVDSSSTIFAGGSNAAISPFAPGQLANVFNAGRLDLTNDSGTSDSLTVNGNYTGQGGYLLLDTVLGADGSPSDKLVISGGTASGSTGISIVNQGGLGGLTTQDGILVVQGINGANTGSGTFGLDTNVAAGAYEYYLFKGGLTSGSAENWYLRSALVNGAVAPAPETIPGSEAVEPSTPPTEPPPPPPAPTPPPEQSATEPPVLAADAAPTAVPPPPAAPAPDAAVAPFVALPVDEADAPSGASRVSGNVVPLYRLEVPTYAVIAPAAREAVMSTLGTFHDRRGDQGMVDAEGAVSAGWLRAFGQSTRQTWSGTVDPSIDGDLHGIQAGVDLFGAESAGGQRDVGGLFFGYADREADVRGQALGWNNLKTGRLDLDATSVGGYWSHIGPSGWYLDGVVMGTWFGGDSRSTRGVGIDIAGSAVTLSLEGGVPIALSESWSIEPQAQLIWQHLSLDNQADRYSSVAFDDDDGITGRIGARLQGSYQLGGGTLRPYLKANLWHEFNGTDDVTFGADPIRTEQGGTSLELGGGVTYDFTRSLSAFATASYAFDVDGSRLRTVAGNIGLRLTW
jgi:autotransporter family porin